MEVKDQQHIKFLKELETKYLGNKPLIAEWCLIVVMLAHIVDDVVDEPKDIERTMEAFSIARRVWSHPTYLKWQRELNIVDELSNSAYIDSEHWKDSTEHWKKVHADVLRHQAYNIFFAVIYLECGREALRECTRHFREYSHLKHINDSPEVFTKVAA